jgi:PAS domain S-box-containing protein
MNPALTDLLDRGQKGIVEATDYRGVPVLAAVQPLAGTPWFLASKIDQEEIYAPLRERSLLLLVVLALLIAAAGLSIVFWWRQKSAEHLRKQYETELERKTLSQRYEYLSEHANDIILLLDPAGSIREANKRAVTAYGYTHDELLQLNIRDLRSPETHTEIAAQMRLVRERGGFLFETVHRRKDGTTFPVEVSSRYIAGDGQSYYQSIIRDITERRQAEASLRERNTFIEAILSSLPMGLAVNNVKDGSAIFMNAQFEEIYGWPKEALVNVDEFFSQVYPDPAQRMKIKEQILSDIKRRPVKDAVGERADHDWERRNKICYRGQYPALRAGLDDLHRFRCHHEQTRGAGLTESEHRYKRLIESVTDYIYTVEIENSRVGATYHSPDARRSRGTRRKNIRQSPTSGPG